MFSWWPGNEQTNAPLAMLSYTPHTAYVLPNRLLISRSSNRRTAVNVATMSLAGIIAHIVVHDDLARNDVGLGRFDLGLHVGGDQLFIVLVERPVDAPLF
jgi:hypothetical protein